MQTTEVKIGYHYKCKVTNKEVNIQLLSEHPDGGWHALNLNTHKKIHIKSAKRLIKPVDNLNKLEDKLAKSRAQRQQAATAAQAKAEETPKPKDAKGKSKSNTGQPKPTTANKPTSLLNAAVIVLETNDYPLSCKDIIEKAIAENLWQPKSGKTPANTLHAAICKEIKTKEKDSRFAKAGRGLFVHSSWISE